MTETKLYTEIVHRVTKPSCWVLDLDDTLCAPDWALHWANSDQFEPIAPMVDLAKMLKRHGYDIVIATARPSTYLEPTLRWLENHLPEFDALYMSNGEVYTKAEEAKEQQLLAIQDRWDIECWIDDSPANCKVVQSYGVPCLRPTRNDIYWAEQGEL